MRYWIAGLLAVAIVGLVETCQSATFDRTIDGAIIMTQQIDQGDFYKFLYAVDREDPKVLVLNGPGGSMIDALAIGEYVRERKIKTVAVGDCFSGCAYIWVAGYRRGMMANAVLGFHGATNMETGEQNAGANAIIGKYLSDCGMPYAFIIDAMAGGKDFRVFDISYIEMMAKTYNLYIFPLITDAQIDFFLRM